MLGSRVDFVQKEGAPLSQLKPASTITLSTGEGATHVPEQLRFEKLFTQSSARHFDERSTAS